MIAKQGGVSSYRNYIRRDVRNLWNGNYNMFEFVDAMISSMKFGLRKAWNEGASSCGIKPDEMTEEEESRLEYEINSQIQYLIGFGNQIMTNSRANKKLLRSHWNRSELWVGAYERVYSIAASMACQDKKLKWVYGDRREHCTDCLRLDGRIYRASIWKKYDLYPHKRTLECGGWKCGCRFEPTDEPATHGRPPKI